MKKKQTIIVIVVAILVLGIIGSIFLKQYLDKKREEKKELEEQQLIEYTKKEYDFYLKNEILEEEKDETKILFNKVNIEYAKNKKIDFSSFVTNLFAATTLEPSNLPNVITVIENEINQYPLEKLDHLKQVDIKTTIKEKKLHLETLIQMYENHELIKQLEEERTKRETYIEELNSLKTELNFFLENGQNYYFENQEYVCKNDEMLAKLNEFIQKYNFNGKAVKEVVKVPTNVGKRVPILCYHGILDVPWGISNLFVRVSDFEEQMKYLSEAGYTPIFASEIASANNYEKPIIITFDDGYKDVYTNAFPILQKYNIKANLYMISGWLGGDVYMTAEMTKEMSNSPLIEIGSHTVSHKPLANLSVTEIEYELSESKRTLETLLGKEMKVIAYPTGSFDSRVIEIARKYYQYGLSTIDGKENPNNLNTYSLRRIYVNRNETIEQFKNSI